MGKARYGSGSVRERRKGVWQLRVNGGTDPATGERVVITETVYGPKKAATDRLDEILRDVRKTPATRATVAMLAERWLTNLRVAAQTERGYRLTVERDVVPRLGDIRLDKLTALHLEDAYTAMLADGVGVHTVRRMHAVMSKMLSDACRWQWLAVNVAKSVTPPATPARINRAVDHGDIGKLITAAQQAGPLVALWLHLHLVTGARRSEVLALRWCDIDLAGGVVSIVQTLERSNGSIVARPGTKTGRGRSVPVGPATVALLVDRLADVTATLGGDPPATGYVIADVPDGSRPWPPDKASHLFRDLCVTAGVSGVRLHDLRHTAISTVIATTKDVLLASRIAGHSRTTTTTDIYGHLLAGQLTAASDALSGLVAPAGDSGETAVTPSG